MLLKNLYLQNKITKEELLERRFIYFRILREQQFKAFDIWERAVLRGRETDDQDVMTWYQEMLDFPDTITELTSYEDYPVLPAALKKYL
ncbi:MAG: hypothetical protein M0Q88_00420 [Bacilli bacterium]|nr:hypothetical protein [Bacilli bacterium]